jgi:hypothetical protein
MQKMAGDVAQVVEHLPSKHRTLSSIPNTAKTKSPRNDSVYMQFLLTELLNDTLIKAFL